MKKHPVDDLFARKLGEWEAKPSSAAWERIQAAQNKKVRRLGGWYWYAAAGVVVVLLAGYAVWQAQPVPKGSEMAGTQVPQVIAPSEVPVPSGSPEVPSYPAQRPEQPSVGYQAQEQLAKVEPKAMPSTAAEATTSEPVLEVAPVIKTAPQEALAFTESTPTRAEEPAIEREESTLALMPEPKVEPAPSRTVIARVDVPEQEEESQKSSRFLKVLRQLKNIKEGEEVDWKEMGINPKKMIARADARLKSEEDKITKKYQNLKEKL